MRFALILGPLCVGVTLLFPAPEGLSDAAWRAAGLGALMAIWWLTEALPLAATALLPLALGPALGIAPIGDLSAAYSHPLILLFLGGFILARAIEQHGLHERLAGALLVRAGTSPPRVLAALMGATAFLSLWISNTASTMVVAPIAASVAAAQGAESRFATAAMLGVAFAATIGGMGSLIGTPPNAFFAAYVSDTHGIEIGFAQWAAIGMPVAVVLLVLSWLLLIHVTPGLGTTRLDRPHSAAHSPMSRGARRVAVIAGLTAGAWITLPLLKAALPDLGLSDAGIALTAALLLFLLPSGEGKRLLNWDQAKSLRWDVLILFGGGLALAQMIEETGLAAWIGAGTLLLSDMPIIVLIFMFATIIVYLGELASNTAMAAIFLPIASAAALAIGVEPLTVMIPVALAASIGFMLPVATPPNAIVFSYPAVTRARMLRSGAPLDVIGIVVAVLLSRFVTALVF